MKTLMLATAGFAFLLSGCGDSRPQDAVAPKLTEAAFSEQFHRGVMELEQHRFPDAAATFDALTKDRPNVVAPWINLAAAQLNRNVEEAHPLCLAAADRATVLDPKAPQPHFLRGILFKHLGKFEDAEKNFRKALEFAPDDPATLYHLASIVADRDAALAAQMLEKAIEGETHLSSAYYALMGLKRRADRAAVGDLLAIFQAFEASNTGAKMNIVYTEMGRLGEAVRDLPFASASEGPASSPPIRFADPITLPGAALTTVDLGGKTAFVMARDPGAPLAIRAWNGTTLALVAGAIPSVDLESSSCAAAGDFDGDGIEDLAIGDARGVRLFKGDGKRFVATPGSPLGAPHPARGCLWSDLDQDGDLDLVTWSGRTVTLLVNRRDGTFMASAQAPGDTKKGFQAPPLPAPDSPVSRVVATDLDSDGDPDLLIATESGMTLWRNDRLMRFTDVTARAGFSGAMPTPLVGDLDGDRLLDVLVTSQDGISAYVQVANGPFRLTFVKRPVSPQPGRPLLSGDIDADGRDEIVLGSPVEKFVSVHQVDAVLAADLSKPAAKLAADPSPIDGILADANGDLAPDVVTVAADAAGSPVTRVLLAEKRAGNTSLAIRLAGKTFANTMHSNMGGIGARVEVMTAGRSRMREMRSDTGNTLYFGLGPSTHADYVRIVWPDDVLQSEGWVPGNQLKVIEEFQRKASSCPILFAWNGERFECVTDFLGTGGLGFFLEPGVYAPPDPTERLLIPNLKPKDGDLEIRIHEPFEEITYLDVARLIVVDHPEAVDVVPDERLAVNAPPPSGELFAIGERIAPVAARDGRKNDILAEVVASDRRQARAFADPRFIGYAEPTTFHFDFGAAFARHAGSDRVVLALDGWVEYPYSHVNLAALQAGVRLEAPSIDVEVEGTGFVRILTEAGYPAGMPRLMTLPLGKLPERLTGRMRLVTNQEIWIDRIFLFEPADAPLATTVIDAARAELRVAGYPREYSPDGGVPRLYDYDIRDPSFPWKTMGGTYTRFGDVAELLLAADDCYVVFGPGEEVSMTFKAPAPPAPGLKRTYILDAVGWCKDMNAYTAHPLTVEPLPFRGMSHYPYAAPEAFPDGAAQRRWRAVYQTRHVPFVRAR